MRPHVLVCMPTMQQARPAKPPIPLQKRCHLDETREPELPVDTSECACDDPVVGSRMHTYSSRRRTAHRGVWSVRNVRACPFETRWCLGRGTGAGVQCSHGEETPRQVRCLRQRRSSARRRHGDRARQQEGDYCQSRRADRCSFTTCPRRARCDTLRQRKQHFSGRTIDRWAR